MQENVCSKAWEGLLFVAIADRAIACVVTLPCLITDTPENVLETGCIIEHAQTRAYVTLTPAHHRACSPKTAPAQEYTE